MMQKTTLSTAALAAAVFVGHASATVVYDAQGFETPSSGFLLGLAEGQDGGSPEREVRFGLNGTNSASNGAIAASVGVGGSDAFRLPLIDNAGVFDFGEYGFVDPDVESVIPTGPVTIGVAINVLQSPAGGPFFGLSGIGSEASGNQPIAFDAFVSSVDGSLFVNSASQFGTVDTLIDVPLGVYNDFEVVLDYAAKSYDLFVNGSLVLGGGLPFRINQVGGDVDGMGRVDDFRAVTFLGFDDGNTSPTPIAGEARYDNLVVVPEPAAGAVLGLVGLAGLRRRR